jgi:hypothetical protein
VGDHHMHVLHLFHDFVDFSTACTVQESGLTESQGFCIAEVTALSYEGIGRYLQAQEV